MRKTLLVLKYEVYTITSRLSFWVVLLGIPLFSLLIFGGAALIQQRFGIKTPSSSMADVEKLFEMDKDAQPKGYVDPGGLVRAFPPEFSAQYLVAYSDQAAARKALDAGEISAFYVISPDYDYSGKLTIYMPDYSLIDTIGNAEIENLINFNLLGGNTDLYQMVNAPVQHLVRESLAPPDKTIRENNSQLALYICMAVMLLFFIGIMGSATLLLNSLIGEKGNRVIETLMVSVSPMQLMIGKIAGLGLVGLAQTVVWSLTMLGTMRLNGETNQLPVEMQLQPSFIAWGMIFFLLGYFLYAAIMAGIGALFSDLREATQITSVIMAPIIIPEILMPTIIMNPHSPLAVIFSLFPLTSPVMIMMRLSLAAVPLWQMLASIALLILSCALVIRAAAGLFRAQTILTGKSFNFSTVFHLLRKGHNKA